MNSIIEISDTPNSKKLMITPTGGGNNCESTTGATQENF